MKDKRKYNFFAVRLKDNGFETFVCTTQGEKDLREDHEKRGKIVEKIRDMTIEEIIANHWQHLNF